MGLGSLRRYGLTFMAAAVVMTMSLSMAASAPAATVGGQPTAQHLKPAQHPAHFQVHATGKPNVLVGDAICLTNSNTHCSGFDANTVYQGVMTAINTAIVIYSILHDRNTGSNKDTSEGDEGGNTDNSGLCLGVTSPNSYVKYMSCSAPHGVWWNWNSYGSGYRVWNTYVQQYLTTPNTNNNTYLRVEGITTGTWQNWITEFCDGC
jgi:hypothetical protein